MSSTSNLPRGRGFRRREFLFATGTAVTASAVGVRSAAASPPEDEGTWLPGFVDRVESAQTVIISTPARPGPVAVDLAPGAQPRRSGAVPLSAFQPGEEVVAHGSWVDERFTATEFETLFRLVDARVQSRDGEVLRTSNGTVRLSTETKLRTGRAGGRDIEGRPLDELDPGDRFVTLGRRNRQTDEVTAILIGEVTS